MSNQPDALRLADLLISSPHYTGTTIWESARELRRLHALNAELVEALQTIMAGVAGCERDPKWEAARTALAKAGGQQ